MTGFYDDLGRYIPKNEVKDEYEIEQQDKDTIEEIKKKLSRHAFKSKDEVLVYVEFLENLNNKLSQVIKEEDSAGNDNWTLKLAREDVQKVFAELRKEYNKF